MPIRLRTLMIAMGLILSLSTRAIAADVVIVRASNAEPYTQAEAAIRQQLFDPKFKIKSLTAREASDKGIDASIGKPDVVVAIGTAAAQAIDALMQKQVDIVWTTPDSKLWVDACVRTLLTSAVRYKIPVWGFSPPWVRAGALTISNSASFQARVISPDSFPIAVNLTVGEQIGIEIPQSLSHRATFIYPEK